MNALRREALLRLADRLKERAPYRINKANIIFRNRKPNKKPQTYISFRDTSAIPQNLECDKLFIPLSSKPELFEKYSAGAVLPRGIFGNFDEIVERLIKAAQGMPFAIRSIRLQRQKGGCSDNRRTVFKYF